MIQVEANADEAFSPQKMKHVSNPYIGADKYINPDYSHEIEYSIKRTKDSTLRRKMRQVQKVPTAIWLDRMEAIAGGKANNNRLSLEEHFTLALKQSHKGKPMLVELVLYNLPNRDCSALSSNGTLDFRTGGLEKYMEYIDTISALVKDARFSSLRFVSILEPDSLPNMVTNLWNDKCKLVYKHKVYDKGIAYAVKKLSNHANSYVYMDIGHSGWLGWDQNIQKTVDYFTDVVENSHSADGLAAIDGFVTNISGSTPTEEVWMKNPNQTIADKPLKSSSFYGWNAQFDEKNYVESLYQAFVSRGFSKDIKFLIDTSRNGWGGVNRPNQPSKASEIEIFVEQSRIDRRFHRGNWCNPSGQGLGERPTAKPYGSKHPIGAFIWVKPPGESDGTSDPNQTAADVEGKRYDQMCDPNYIVDFGPTPSKKPTGALSNAPASGHWFHKQFVMLIENAYPPL